MVMRKKNRSKSFFFQSAPQAEPTESIRCSKSYEDKVSYSLKHHSKPDSQSQIDKRINECKKARPEANIKTVKQVKTLVTALLKPSTDADEKDKAILDFKTYYHFDLSPLQRKKLNAHVIQLPQTSEYLFFEDVIKKIQIKVEPKDIHIQFLLQFLYNYWLCKATLLFESENGKRFEDKIDQQGPKWVMSEFILFDNKTAREKLDALRAELANDEKLVKTHEYISGIIDALKKDDNSNYRFWFANCMLTYIYELYFNCSDDSLKTLLSEIYSKVINIDKNAKMDAIPLNEPHRCHLTNSSSKSNHNNSSVAASSSSLNDYLSNLDLNTMNNYF